MLGSPCAHVLLRATLIAALPERPKLPQGGSGHPMAISAASSAGAPAEDRLGPAAPLDANRAIFLASAKGARELNHRTTQTLSKARQKHHRCPDRGET